MSGRKDNMDTDVSEDTERLVTVEVKFHLKIRLDAGADISEIMDELDCEFSDCTESADVVEDMMMDYGVVKVEQLQ